MTLQKLRTTFWCHAADACPDLPLLTEIDGKNVF